MKHRTSSSNLKANMGKFMRAVRAGQEVVVTDRDQPVARLVPIRTPAPAERDELPISRPKDPAAPPLSAVAVRPIRYRGPSTTAMLEEDRGGR